MKKVIYSPRFLLTLASFFLLLTALPNPGKAVGEELTYDESPDQVILEYNIVANELAEQDTTPRIRIYGDGKTSVHYPKYMKKAGRYSLVLTKAEVKKALKLIADYGLLSFNKIKTKELKKQKDIESARKRKESGLPEILTMVSDPDTTHIFYNLLTMTQDNETGTTIQNTRVKKISYTGLREDRKQYPEIKEIQGLGHVEDWFQGLTRRPDLKKINEKK